MFSEKFRKGNRHEYTGGRTADTIVSWVEKRTGAASAELECDDILPTVDQNDVNVVYFGATEGSLYDSFIEVAKTNEKFKFYNACCSCAEAHGAEKPSITIFRKHEDSPVHYKGDVNVADIKKWMAKKSLPSLIQFDHNYVQPVFKEKMTSIILFSNDQSARYRLAFASAAEVMKDDSMLFVMTGTKTRIEQTLFEFSQVREETVIAILKPGKVMRRYIYKGDLDSVTADDIVAFVTSFKNGSLTPDLRSQPEPEEQGAVITLVGTTYNKIVMDPTKDVFVDHYAPNCPHCKDLDPAWQALAEQARNIPDLVIAKYDDTANEVEGLLLRGYPTIALYRKDHKDEPFYYQGETLELDEIAQWLAHNSSAYKLPEAAHEEDL